MENKNLAEFLSGVKGCQFVSLREYANANGDVCDYVIAAGISYMTLIGKRLAGLSTLTTDAIVDACKGKLDKAGLPITANAVEIGLNDLRESYQRTLDGVSVWNAADVFAPVVIDGVTVRCAKTYVGNVAAEPGTIYLSGVIVSRKVLVAGPEKPEPKSRPDVIAKKVIEKMLTDGGFGGSIVSFKCAPNQARVINANGGSFDL